MLSKESNQSVTPGLKYIESMRFIFAQYVVFSCSLVTVMILMVKVEDCFPNNF